MISPVADLIKARNRPFIFATGYGSSGLPEEYRDRPALQKPFQLETLGKMIDIDAARRDGVGTDVPLVASDPVADDAAHFSVSVSASENASSVRSSRSGVTET